MGPAISGPVAGLPASPQDVELQAPTARKGDSCYAALSLASRLSPTKRCLSSQGPLIDVYPPSSGSPGSQARTARTRRRTWTEPTADEAVQQRPGDSYQAVL
ncbi:hypothetical protein CSIM01_00413 [Colletotrichum simmondsii]|uniref:Uncharacterized protein n=1 Tax=Colletotrichum simmondsii TaxID=703756 RepID=A0A135SF09_9PEZI|nr:hypothetical protein CSIM01_00413 [Colletotrichum simmondsii]